MSTLRRLMRPPLRRPSGLSLAAPGDRSPLLFVGSLVRWFVGSLVRWFVGSLVGRLLYEPFHFIHFKSLHREKASDCLGTNR
jgi:hypothetical protein